jgi:hypothetical protein
MRTAPALLLAISVAASAGAAGDAAKPARIYRWVDQNGVAHYTTHLDQVPVELRNLISEPKPLTPEQLSAQAPASVDSWVGQDRPPVSETPPDAGAGPAAPSPELAALDRRIGELEAAIEADEAALKQDVTDAGASESNDALKAIAARLPGRIEELKKLKAQREQLAPRPE